MAYAGNKPLYGLHPVNNGVAGTVPHIGYYDVAAAYTTAIGEGCLVIKSATGLTLAGAAVAAGGFVVGVAAHDLAGSTGGKIAVYDDPKQEFMIVPDGTMTTTVQIEMVGQFAALLTNTKNTTLGGSNAKLDISTATGTRSTTNCMQIVGVGAAVGDTYATTQAGYVGQIRVKIPEAIHIWTASSVTRAT